MTRTLGTDRWKDVFYATDAQGLLFDDRGAGEHKVGDVNRVGLFVLDRLKSIFAKVAPNPLTLRNSRQTPIYLLCFAAGNPNKADHAVGIAGDILK